MVLTDKERRSTRRIMRANCWIGRLATLAATVSVLGLSLSFLLSGLILRNEGLIIGAIGSLVAGMIAVWLIRTILFYRCIIQKLAGILQNKAISFDDVGG